MISLTIISVGNLKENYLRDAYSEYKKRLSQYARVEEVSIKEVEIKNEGDKAEIQRALDAEGEIILSKIPSGAIPFSLCVEGKEYDSPSLARLIETEADRCGKLAFIIGSSHGLSENVKAECKHRLSISKLTFPHQLTRVLLSEILYRSFTIIAGKKYHK